MGEDKQPRDKLSEEECKQILIMAEVVATTILAQFNDLKPEISTGLQLGMIKAISVLWASCASADPAVVFDKIMDAMPPIVKTTMSGYIQ